MDRATLSGLILIGGSLTSAALLGGTRFGALWHFPSLLAVLGGTCGAMLICLPRDRLRDLPAIAMKALFNRPPDHAALLAILSRMADRARRAGLVSLEAEAEAIDDPFLKRGLRLLADGTPAHVVDELLRADTELLAAHHKEEKYVFDQLGRFAPAFGLIGTLLGLVAMLGKLSDPSLIGAGMAVALMTTLYGAVLANAVFLPIADKLGLLARRELLARELMIRGLLAIHAGEVPSTVRARLETLLSTNVAPRKAA